MDRDWNNSVLRMILGKLSKDEIITCLIGAINAICTEDKTLKEVSHGIITQIQVQEIMAERDKLENYKEPHRSELKKELERRKWISDPT